ncbi:multidrug and toxin extrusion protein 1-like [Myripristis murdjan]|uniref:multidrug and toxin extrusion protein 1-like n=1 Tax=Myripristis murdjan TaxID=586833 RepID=UPI00117636F9|nr:multidrug and toxin extrusion protein 1-like [Myripristis murdjan]
MEEPSAKLFCCEWVRRRVPLVYREELYHTLRMAGPVLFSRILQYMLPFVITMFCGRLGNEVMAAYGLASATINVSTAATGYGLTLGCHTLVSQTFGGKNLLRVGVILQRSVLILLLFCLPCWSLLINAEAILLCLGQRPEVARIAQLYIIAYLPAVPATFLHHLLLSYLQNQSIILPQVYSAALANVANIATNYILVSWLDLGVHGSAAANTLSQIYICAFLFAYIWWKKLHEKTWGGWSAESLQEWGSYMKLAIPSTFMTCFEWWIYEFGGFFAGMLSENDLAAQHAVMMVSFINYMFPLGVQGAACVRVGNALGAGDTEGAIRAGKVSILLAGTMAIVQGLVLGSTKTVIGFIFTSDQQIADLVAYMMNAYCAVQCFDALVCVCTGIFLGSGQQKIPAVANLIGYYCIGLPLAITFMFVVKLGCLGFWLGLLVCVCVQSTFNIIVIFRLNWKRLTEEAVKRAKKNTHVALMKTPQYVSVVSQMGVDGYISVSTESKDGNAETQSGAEPRRRRLSPAQLILRRGLTLIVLLALLAVGISVHSLVPLPESRFSEGNLTDWINTTQPTDQIQSTPLGLEAELG